MKAVRTFVSAVLAGFCIGFGGTAYLSADNAAVGAVLFAVGLFTVCTFGFSLYTGKVCYAVGSGLKGLRRLIIVWLGNLAGTWALAELMRMTRSGIAGRAAELCAVKSDDGTLSLFILAAFCNVFIYIAVEGYRSNPHGIGKYLSILFGVTVFILCGFEHSVADMFYFFAAGDCGMHAVRVIATVTLGNAAGGIAARLLHVIAKGGAEE